VSEVRPAQTLDPSYAGHVRWALWGTYAFLAVDRPSLLPRARAVADEVLAGVESEVSRFRADSDLSRANAAAGSWSAAGPLLVAATRAALWAAEQTDGLVDPCLGRALVSLGYDDDLATVRGRRSWDAAAPPPRLGAWQDLRVTDDAVRVPAGTALDLGATGKAWAADLVATTVAATFDCTCVVSLGGDVSVQGPGEWPVRVSETPDGDGPLVWLRGGLATSSTLVRRWRGPAGSVVHHVLDPRTGQPAPEVHRTVSCVGGDALRANAASTAALVLGAGAAAWLQHHDVAARLVGADGGVTRVGAWPDDLKRA
jgi:thiamine biosynthesis lipoprotein